jgi:hypothetical protein
MKKPQQLFPLFPVARQKTAQQSEKLFLFLDTRKMAAMFDHDEPGLWHRFL